MRLESTLPSISSRSRVKAPWFLSHSPTPRGRLSHSCCSLHTNHPFPYTPRETRPTRSSGTPGKKGAVQASSDPPISCLPATSDTCSRSRQLCWRYPRPSHRLAPATMGEARTQRATRWMTLTRRCQGRTIDALRRGRERASPGPAVDKLLLGFLERQLAVSRGHRRCCLRCRLPRAVLPRRTALAGTGRGGWEKTATLEPL